MVNGGYLCQPAYPFGKQRSNDTFQSFLPEMSLISIFVDGLKTCQTKYGKKSLHLHGIHVISTWLIDFNRCWVSPPFLWTKKTHPALLRQIRKIIQAQTTRSRTTGQGVSDQMFTFDRGSRSGKKNISYHHIRTKQIKTDHISYCTYAKMNIEFV